MFAESAEPSAADAFSDPARAEQARRQIGDAMVELVLEHGYKKLRVEALCEAAGVSKARFDALFENLEVAYIWTHKQNMDDFDRRVVGAFEAHDQWREAIRAAAYAAARFIEERPDAIQFGSIEMYGAGDLAQAERERQLESMIDLVDAGRGELSDPDSKDRSVALGIFLQVYARAANEVKIQGTELRASEYVAESLYMVVLPYLGQEAAEEELARGPEDLERYKRGEI